MFRACGYMLVNEHASDDRGRQPESVSQAGECMMRNCINRPWPARHAVAASCRHGCGQASPPGAKGRTSASCRCLPRRVPRLAEKAAAVSATTRPRPWHGSGANLDESGQPSAGRPHPSKEASGSFIRRVRRMERP